MEKQVGQEYMSWKSWQDNEFGLLTAIEARRYEAEMACFKLPTGARVLEIGYGRGGFLSFAKQQGWQCVGIELNDELVAIGREAGFDVGNVERYAELEPASFDLVVAFDVFEHMTHQQIGELLALLSTLLSPNGEILARFPNGDSPIGLPNQNGDPTHVNAIGAEKIRYYVEAAGAELVSLKGEARPLRAGKLTTSLYRCCTLPLRGLVGLTAMLLFPQFGPRFCAANIVARIKF
jgi:2-polyprenyl-3-methyl-5-hydroxy-6-metoxy-1,4-benzoquinol methylase